MGWATFLGGPFGVFQSGAERDSGADRVTGRLDALPGSQGRAAEGPGEWPRQTALHGASRDRQGEHPPALLGLKSGIVPI